MLLKLTIAIMIFVIGDRILEMLKVAGKMGKALCTISCNQFLCRVVTFTFVDKCINGLMW